MIVVDTINLGKYLWLVVSRPGGFNVMFLSYRVFVNRSLHLEKIKFYGFDMDYTLASKCI